MGSINNISINSVGINWEHIFGRQGLASEIFHPMDYYRNHYHFNRMAWQWAETLVEIRVNLADIRGTTK